MTPMSRVVSTKIEFEFDEALANEGRDTPMTDEEMTDYAISCFVDDIYNMVKYNELQDAVRVEWKGKK
jgi:hypothetical protein